MVDAPGGVIGVWFRRNQQQMRHGLLKRKYTETDDFPRHPTAGLRGILRFLVSQIALI